MEWHNILSKNIFHLVFNRSHTDGVRELCMNMDKVVYANLVGKCDHRI